MKKLLFIILLFTAFMCLTTHHLTAADIDKKDVFAVEQSLKAQDWLQIMQIVKKWPNSADEIDVFKRLSKLNSLSDEARFWCQFRVSQLYQKNEQPQEALDLLRPLQLDLDNTIGKPDAMINLLLCDIYDDLLHYDSSMVFIDKLLLRQSHKYLEQSEADLFNRKANLCNRLYDYKNALKYYTKVIENAYNDSSLIANAYHGYAYTYRKMGQLDSSVFFEYKSLRISEIINYEYGKQLALQSLSINAFYQKEYQRSIELGKQLVEIVRATGKKTLLANTYNVIGLSYTYSSRPDSGLFFHKKSLAIKQEIGNNNLICSSFNNIAASFLVKQMPDSAIVYLLKAKPIFESLKDTLKISSLYANIGNVYVKYKNFDKAQVYYEQAYDLANQMNAKSESITGLEGLMVIDTLRGDYRSAFYNQKQIQKLKEEYLDLEKHNEITNLREKYQSDKKDEEIKAQQALLSAEQALSITKTRFLIGSLFLLVICVFFFLVYFRLNKRNKKLKNKNAILLREQNHRIKNNLQSIVAMLSLQSNRIEDVGVKKVLEESQLRIQTIELIHRRLYGNQSSVVDIKDLFPELVESVLFALGKQEVKFNCSLNGNMNFKVEVALSLALILNELVTNSCVHGLPSEVGMPKINLTIQPHFPGTVGFSYCDNGVGFDHESIMRKSSSFGLKLIDLKCKELGGDYSFRSEPGEMRFNLDFSVN